MKDLLRAAPLLLLIGFSLGVGSGFSPDSVAASDRHYVCPPCGLPCDDAVYDAPGTCPKCGMALVAREEAARAPKRTRTKVAILIFTGVEIIDYTGPYEMFGAADFDVYTVGETKAPVTTAMGMTVVPRYGFADAPLPDVLVVPGGGVRAARDNQALLKWVRDVTARVQHTMSVCNGAFILASAGLLDGLTATTTAPLIDQLGNEYPRIKVVHDRRFVDNGKIITAAGLSSGIDAALHVIAVMKGNGMAQQTALSEEYDWHPASGFARAALADRLIPEVDLRPVGDWTIESTQGGTDRWETVLRGTSDRSASDLIDYFGKAFIERAKWTRQSGPAATGGAPSPTSAWKFAGRDGRPWNGTLTVAPIAGQSHGYEARLTIARVSNESVSR
jgi:putative intracellular protease/amidase